MKLNAKISPEELKKDYPTLWDVGQKTKRLAPIMLGSYILMFVFFIIAYAVLKSSNLAAFVFGLGITIISLSGIYSYFVILPKSAQYGKELNELAQKLMKQDKNATTEATAKLIGLQYSVSKTPGLLTFNSLMALLFSVVGLLFGIFMMVGGILFKL